MSQSGKAVKLPVKNDLGFFEIRMESIGGLGANVAGKILELLVAQHHAVGCRCGLEGSRAGPPRRELAPAEHSAVEL